jgi:hypothetical protein
MSIFSNAVNFGKETVGANSSPRTISISNPSGTPIVINPPKITGPMQPTSPKPRHVR